MSGASEGRRPRPLRAGAGQSCWALSAQAESVQRAVVEAGEVGLTAGRRTARGRRETGTKPKVSWSPASRSPLFDSAKTFARGPPGGFGATAIPSRGGETGRALR